MLGHETAAALAGAFLRDIVITVNRVAESGMVDPVAFYRPSGGKGDIERFVGTEMALEEQFPGDLGPMMAAAMVSLLERHPKGGILIGSDLPTLPAEVIAAAAGHLLRPGRRVVFGPARDGGFYLVGVNTPAWGELFAPLEWSTPGVLRAMKDRATAAGLEICEVATWRDVDTVDDLDRLSVELDQTAGVIATHTRALLKSLL